MDMERIGTIMLILKDKFPQSVTLGIEYRDALLIRYNQYNVTFR